MTTSNPDAGGVKEGVAMIPETASEPGFAMGSTTTDQQQWTPTVSASIRPTPGRVFKTLNEGINCYINYARIYEFDVRQSSVKRDRDGEIYSGYLVCSRQGVKGGGNKPHGYERVLGGREKRERRCRLSNRVNCGARIGFTKKSSGEFEVSVLVEEHTHKLCSEPSKVFMRINRRLGVVQQAFLSNCVKANIGASTGLRFCKEKTGSYANIGATDVEFHNFKRDVQTYINVADGEMIIATFKAKHEACSDFFFEYDLDEEHRVSRLFWTDPLSRRKFSCYGDNISFDATYGTNRYSMVFVPFTGVDNHKRCITFGAGLLIKEDADSYSWLLEQFICAMGKRPVCVVTDQDPAMRIAIERVLPECHHRYCMWHIMTNVNEKLVSELAKDNEFRKKLNAIIWNDTIDRVEFEAQWQLLMDEYNLSTYRWFCKMYAERES
ncbi:PREDICTED: protein FAR1-RELATED SEQUENCE 5-like [Ipomoea nil]|uniref:protein FAR1-RELATED SEQUENCE 5-like n=1 Tax=Ipomoea nil TaxID=35883 RepID=UPI000900BE87|nr:PREDICTED: protein FAR1-RELATED SEQUENCE 5-like [Ipomoea nil]